MKKRPKRYGITWTKNITRILLSIGVLGGMLPYVLSLAGKDPCTEMGIAWVTSVVAVALGYFVRGFKDTKAEEDARLKELEINGGLTFLDLEKEAHG